LGKTILKFGAGIKIERKKEKEEAMRSKIKTMPFQRNNYVNIMMMSDNDTMV
jgi:hypothetical protein